MKFKAPKGGWQTRTTKHRNCYFLFKMTFKSEMLFSVQNNNNSLTKKTFKSEIILDS